MDKDACAFFGTYTYMGGRQGYAGKDGNGGPGAADGSNDP